MSRKHKLKKRIDVDEVREFILNCSPETIFYFGADSTSEKKNGVWYATYAVVIVVHINGKNGCRIFGDVTRERDYSKDTKNKKKSQRMRLITESYKVGELFKKFEDLMATRKFEVHLDYNPNPRYASNEVVQEAIGYVMGTCGVKPKIKPVAWAASYAADRIVKINGGVSQDAVPAV